MAPTARVAFVEVCTTDRASYRAAGLVTDPLGDPVEFRCTDPVRPTRMQKVLWGGRLTGHLLVHVLGKPLFNAFAPPPGLVVVRQPLLLGLREAARVPVVQLGTGPAQPGGRVLVGVGGADPVHLVHAPGYAADADLASDALTTLAKGVSPLEPFTRVLQAVGLIQQEETPVQAV